MLRQFSSSHDNGQSMVIYPSSMKHAPSVVIVSWQRSEHGHVHVLLGYETCSASWHRLMTTDRAWLFTPKVWSMLCWLSSHDNGLSMVIYPSGMKHATSVVIVSCQWTEHGYLSLRYVTCSVTCHRPMTTVRAWWYPTRMKHAPSVAIVSWQRSEHGNVFLRQERCSVSRHRRETPFGSG